MSEHIIALRGESSLKELDGFLEVMTPFVGTDGPGKFSEFGIGLLSVDDQVLIFWGTVVPHALIQSWRAMKLLEQISSLKTEILSACWHLARPESLIDDDLRYFRSLNDLSAAPGTAEKLRGEVLSLFPSTALIDQMIRIFRNHSIDLDVIDLQTGVASGKILSSPLIDALIEERERKSVLHT
jgi:hypothetical protein